MSTIQLAEKPVCGRCDYQRTSRRTRMGFFQKTVLLKLGYFPCECNACWKPFLSRLRGHRTRRSKDWTR